MSTRAEEIAAEEYPDDAFRKADRATKDFPAGPYPGHETELRRAAFIKGYKQGHQDRWIPITEQIPDGNVWLSGYAYNDPANEDFWQKPGYYHGGILHANDEFDPWDGYPPTHWMPAPAPPSPHNHEQP